MKIPFKTQAQITRIITTPLEIILSKNSIYDIELQINDTFVYLRQETHELAFEDLRVIFEDLVEDILADYDLQDYIHRFELDNTLANIVLEQAL
jgi:hypothetical protein